MLTWILEMQLNIWLSHKMILCRKFAFRSVLMDYLDLTRNITVHHRLRSQMGTILHGAVSTHFYNWNDLSKFMFQKEYGFTWQKLSNDRELTKPFYYIYSPTRMELADLPKDVPISFAHRNGNFQSMFVIDPDGRKGNLQDWMKVWLFSEFPKPCFGMSGNPCARWVFSSHIEDALKSTIKYRPIRKRSTSLYDFGVIRKT